LASRTRKLKGKFKRLKIRKRKTPAESAKPIEPTQAAQTIEPTKPAKQVKKRLSFTESVQRGPIASYRKRTQKERDMLTKEGRAIKIAAFITTAIAMSLALSFIPFFSAPLPILIAVALAFAVYISPPAGMAIGCLSIALGILYQLSLIDFIAMLGPTIVRVLFICILLFFFIALPARFRSYEDAVGINFGIIAASALFFDSTFFIAIPLLLTVTILFKRTQSGLAFVYYALISIPLMVMQYFQHIITIARSDFWNDATAVPPIYTSLHPVYLTMQNVMPHFRLFDISISVGKITWNVVEVVQYPPVHTVAQAVQQYTDSFPGVILFITLVAALVLSVSLILPSFTGRGKTSRIGALFPAVAAVGITALFFILLKALALPLAYSTSINNTQIALGIVSALAFAVPASLLNMSPKKKAEKDKNKETILIKAGALMAKVQEFEGLVTKVKVTVPVDISKPEAKSGLIKERLTFILGKAEAGKLKLNETYDVIKELDGDLEARVTGLSAELNVILQHYQLNLNYSYTTWVKRLRELGYDVKDPLQIQFQKEQAPEQRIEYIALGIATGKKTAAEVCALAEQIYDVLRSMYDPSLPFQSATTAYCKQKLLEKQPPWLACDALVIAIKNWTRQYENEISKSIIGIQESLSAIAALGEQQKTLQVVLGAKYQLVADEIKRAVELKPALDNFKAGILGVIALKGYLESTLDIANGVVSTFYEDLKTKEESITDMSVSEEDFWEKNVPLRDQMGLSIDKISNTKKYTLFEMMKAIPENLSHIGPCTFTIDQYNGKKEMLLNYPVAKTAIEELLKKKKRISVQDMPFDAYDAEKYLKLYFNEKNKEFTFDEENQQLIRKN
jgi:hypothetical protein